VTAIPWLSWIPGAGRWLWSKIRGRPTVQADRGAVAAGRDQAIKDSVISAQQALRGERGALVAAVQHFHAPVTIISLSRYPDELPDVALEGPPESFKEAERLEAAGEHAGAIGQYEKAFAAAGEDYNRCVLHIRIARNFRELNRPAEAEGHLLEALDLARRATERELEAVALWGLGLATYDRNWGRAEAYSREAVDAFESLGDQRHAARVMILLGLVHRQQDRSEEAEQSLIQALGIYRGLGDEEHQALCLYDLANVYRDRGDPESLSRAAAAAEQALAMYDKLGDRQAKAKALYTLALVYDSRTDPASAQKAEERYLAASELYRADGDIARQGDALNRAGRDASTRGDQPAALERCSHALALFEEAGDQRGAADALANLGIIHLQRAGQALDNLDATHTGPAQIQQLQEHAEEARDHILRSLALYRQLGDLRNEAFGTAILSFALLLRLDFASSNDELRRARDLFSQVGDLARAEGLSGMLKRFERLEHLQAAGAPKPRPKRARRRPPPKP